MNIATRVIIILILALTLSCGGSKDPLPEEEIEVIEDPVAASLVFPENNTECPEGTIISDTQSRVVFVWNASEHTDSYEVKLENLDLNTSSVFKSNVNELAITLERGTAYRWSVVSKSNINEKVADSEVWQFYNAGAGIVNHAPFPAEVVSPANNSEVAISERIVLKWEADDVDDDIISYEIYLGANNPPTESIGTTTNKEMTVDIVANSTYYWYILTADSANNSSKSDVYSFSTE